MPDNIPQHDQTSPAEESATNPNKADPKPPKKNRSRRRRRGRARDERGKNRDETRGEQSPAVAHGANSIVTSELVDRSRAVAEPSSDLVNAGTAIDSKVKGDDDSKTDEHEHGQRGRSSTRQAEEHEQGGHGHTKTKRPTSKRGKNRRKGSARGLRRLKNRSRSRSATPTRVDGVHQRSLLFYQHNNCEFEIRVVKMERGRFKDQPAIRMLLEAFFQRDNYTIQDLWLKIKFEAFEKNDGATQGTRRDDGHEQPSETTERHSLDIWMAIPRLRKAYEVSVDAEKERTDTTGLAVEAYKFRLGHEHQSRSNKQMVETSQYSLTNTTFNHRLTTRLERKGTETQPPGQFNFQLVLAHNDDQTEPQVAVDLEIDRGTWKPKEKAIGAWITLSLDNIETVDEDYSKWQAKTWQAKNGHDGFENNATDWVGMISN